MTHSEVGTPVHGVKFHCLHASFSVPSIDEAADAMCTTKGKSKEKEREDKSKETEREENKNLINIYMVAFRKCNVCSNWAMQFRGSGRDRIHGDYNTLVNIRRNFRAGVRKARARSNNTVEDIESSIGDHVSVCDSTNTPPCRSSEDGGHCVSGERYGGTLNN
jgi:hypothetical protein